MKRKRIRKKLKIKRHKKREILVPLDHKHYYKYKCPYCKMKFSWRKAKNLQCPFCGMTFKKK